jgi:hypothetical protein
MLLIDRLQEAVMETDPFEWKFIDRLFSPEDAAALAASFPRDKFKEVKGYDGEKSYVYVSRSLSTMWPPGDSARLFDYDATDSSHC